MALNRQTLIETGFRLFADRTVEAVSLEEIARESGIGVATLYRYFGTKTDLAVAVSVRKWEEFWKSYVGGEETAKAGMTGADRLSFYLDSYVDLYRHHRDLLRFNQFFNVYLHGAADAGNRSDPYGQMIERIEERFRGVYEQGRKDGTLKGGISCGELFSATMHLMLAAATRFAVGLAYRPEGGADPLQELLLLKNMLMKEYTCA